MVEPSQNALGGWKPLKVAFSSGRVCVDKLGYFLI